MLFAYDLIGKSVSNKNMFHFPSAPLWSCFVLLFSSASLLNPLSLYGNLSVWRFLLLFVLLVLVRISGKRERRGSNLFKYSWLFDDRFSSLLQKEFTLIYTIYLHQMLFSCIKLNYTVWEVMKYHVAILRSSYNRLR